MTDEPMVRIVEAHCDVCGAPSRAFRKIPLPAIVPVSFLRERLSDPKHTRHPGCTGHVIVATEPVEEKTG